jgi:hypothetical protein
MLSDPPTAPARLSDQIAFGTLTAAAAAGLELTAHNQTFLITALLAANIFAAAARSIRRRGAPAHRVLAAGRPPNPTRSFQAQLTGSFRQTTTASGLAEIQLPLTVAGQPLNSLYIRLYGRPTAAGVAIISSQVTLGSRSDPTLYHGAISTVHGTSITAIVRDSAGRALALQAQLQIRGASAAVSGTLTARPTTDR